MIRLQHKKIRVSFQKSFYDEEHEHRNSFYQRLNTFVSREAQRPIVEEYNKVEWMGTDKFVCGFSLKRTYGLPCACELGQYKLMGEPIPLDSVHIQWRKLSMEWKRVLKSKLCELAFPCTSSMCPPPKKVKIKGRVKKSKGKKSDGYDSKKRQVSQSKKQPSQSSQSSKHLLWIQFPDVIQPYIDDIFDVATNENCGFRAIALLLGHSEECRSFVHNSLDQEIASHLKMKDGFPMPDIAPGWKQYRTDEATSWAIAYTRRLRHWGYLLGRLPRVTQNPPTETVDAMSLGEL
ncbi:uncharacterized protein [Cicer arietinum]|uniref:uncharacterized protein n=1 Tax=Cicer arietinum TaxID=3827 RepID=UPI003CC664A4